MLFRSLTIMLHRKKFRQTNENGNLSADINETFIDACESGDYKTVNRILREIKDFNIDVTDNLGKTALRLAVENEQFEVVQLLLDKSDSQKLREALLLAIYLGHLQIAESILRHPKYKILNEKKFVNESTDSFWQTPSSDDAQFSPDITPLILAAQYKRTEIVQMLLLAGDRIAKPHDFQCKCTECSNKFKFDSLRHAKSRLNAYRGLASESYISLASVDPILTAFELGHELRSLSGKEKFFKSEYSQLADNLSLYAVRLLNNVRGRDELDIILNKCGKENEEKYSRLARIDLALRYQEKPFVANSNCQQKLVEIWYSGIRSISKMNQLMITLLIPLFILILPFACLAHIIAPTTKVGRFICQPCVKFLAHTLTYIGFVGTLIVSSLKFTEEQQNRERFSEIFPQYNLTFRQYTTNTLLKYRFPAPDFFIRMHRPSNLDYVITIWIIGFLWHESQQMFCNNFKQYFLSWSNIFNFSMSVFYFCYFALKYYTIIVVSLNITKISDEAFWRRIAELDPSDYNEQRNIYEAFYWLNDDRFYWIPLDPINLAEGLFAIGNIFSFSRFCFLLPANELLGPLQITLGKMIYNVFKFIIMFLIIFIAFLFALNNIYWYYDETVRSTVEIAPHFPGGEESNAEKYFSTIRKTLDTNFWVLFGLDSGKEIFLKPNFNNTFTQDIGIIIYGASHIAGIIMLVNMLIAMMTKSYERIRLASDNEWKFARAKLYMEFIRESTKLPAPFNLLPTSHTFISIFKKVKNFIGINKNDTNNNQQRRKHHVEVLNGLTTEAQSSSSKRFSTEVGNLTYKKVMQRIVKRSLLKVYDCNACNMNSEGVKQNLQMFRYEIHNDLQKSKQNALKSLNLLNNGINILKDGLKFNSESNLLKSFEYNHGTNC